MTDPVFARFQAICPALPEAAEKQTWGWPTFRVRDKIFAGLGTDEEGARAIPRLVS
jgi:hypothetical protein